MVDAPCVSGPYCRQCQEARLVALRALIKKRLEQIRCIRVKANDSGECLLDEHILETQAKMIAVLEEEMRLSRDLREVLKDPDLSRWYGRKAGDVAI